MNSAGSTSASRLPQLVLAFYGDDFTGSTAVLESLANSGLRTLLFLSPPGPEVLQKYPDLQVVGVAGVSRSLTTSEMESELRRAFARLRDWAPPLLHYKVCSTFDTSPEIGSIGKALEIGWEICGKQPVPIVVGAPALGRFCVFGNLFAAAGDEQVYRLDRHPTMSRHPITPMHESDLRAVLARETDLRVNLVDVLRLRKESPTEIERDCQSSTAFSAVLFDMLDADDLQRIGEILWHASAQSADAETRFVVGSTGVEDALCSYWDKAGLFKRTNSLLAPQAVDQVVCISGSCSPVTDRQIAYALQSGFAELAIDPTKIVRQGTSAFIENVLDEIRPILSTGQSLIMHTARGRDDPRIRKFSQEVGTAQPAEVIGTALGQVLCTVGKSLNLNRIVLAGGDTSGYVARRLGIEALEYKTNLATGVPLCNAYRAEGGTIELALKGGQVGGDDFFVKALKG